MTEDEIKKEYKSLFGEDIEPWQLEVVSSGSEHLNVSSLDEMSLKIKSRKRGHYPLIPNGTLVTSSGLNYTLFSDKGPRVNHLTVNSILFSPGVHGYVMEHAWVLDDVIQFDEIRGGVLQQHHFDLMYKILQIAPPEKKQIPGHEFYWARYDWIVPVQTSLF